MTTPRDSVRLDGLFPGMFAETQRANELQNQVAALTKEIDRLRSALAEAEARASRLAKLHAAKGAA